MTGVTSAVSNLIFPGSGKVVATAKDVFKQIGKSTATGYVGDVSTGLAGLRGKKEKAEKPLFRAWERLLVSLGSIGAVKNIF